jgi:hypothetical protein
MMDKNKKDKEDLIVYAKLLQDAGRGKDTKLVHLTDKEVEMLKLIGGGYTKNPKTGLMEFAIADKNFTAVANMLQHYLGGQNPLLPAFNQLGVSYSPEAATNVYAPLQTSGLSASQQASTPASASSTNQYVPPPSTVANPASDIQDPTQLSKLAGS